MALRASKREKKWPLRRMPASQRHSLPDSTTGCRRAGAVFFACIIGFGGCPVAYNTKTAVEGIQGYAEHRHWSLDFAPSLSGVAMVVNDEKVLFLFRFVLHDSCRFSSFFIIYVSKCCCGFWVIYESSTRGKTGVTADASKPTALAP